MIQVFEKMAKTRDIRVIRTQTALLEALEEIIRSKKLSDVTITELCSVARINRNTFYYHYNNISEFLDEHKQIILEELSEIPEVSRTHSKENLIEIIRCIRRHPYFINIIVSTNCDLDFFSPIFDMATKKTSVFLSDKGKEQSSRERLLAAYCNAGSNAVMIAWILGGMNEKPEEVADIIWDAAHNGVSEIVFPDGKKS